MWLACLLLLLGSAIQGKVASADDVQAVEDFDGSRFLGTWYVTAMASNCPYVTKYVKDGMKMVLESGEEEDKFTVTMTKTKRGSCYQRVSTYELIENGKFFTVTTWKHSKNMTLTVVRTDYETYGILYSSKAKKDKTTQSMRMLVRNPDVSEELMNEFRSLCLEVGLKEENILSLPYTECIPAEEGRRPVRRSMLRTGPRHRAFT